MFNRKNLWAAAIVLVAYATFQLMADVAATKLVTVGSLVLPGGTFAFALTFTLRDLIHKQLGAKVARAVVVASAILNIITAGYFAWVGGMSVPGFYGFDQWGLIFALAPSIALGSIGAELTSQLIDTEVYEYVRRRGWPQWVRVLLSNTAGAPVDSAVFTLLAFTLLPLVFGGESRNFFTAISLGWGQAVLKWVIGVVSMPLIYLIPEGNTE